MTWRLTHVACPSSLTVKSQESWIADLLVKWLQNLFLRLWPDVYFVYPFPQLWHIHSIYYWPGSTRIGSLAMCAILELLRYRRSKIRVNTPWNSLPSKNRQKWTLFWQCIAGILILQSMDLQAEIQSQRFYDLSVAFACINLAAYWNGKSIRTSDVFLQPFY
jgi:hypothetical protein